jgi:hypothetical protein
MRISATSLRAAAREVGMSPTGLKKFAAGTSPYSGTLRSLVKWYVRHRQDSPGELVFLDVWASVSLLTFDFDVARRAEKAAELLGLLERAYARDGKTTPAWFGEVLSAFGHDEPAVGLLEAA